MSKYVPPWYSAEMLIGAGLTYLTQYFFYFQPGVDRHAVMRWLLETFPDPVHSCILTTFCILLLLPAVIISVYGVLYHFEWSIFERYNTQKRAGSRACSPATDFTHCSLLVVCGMCCALLDADIGLRIGIMWVGTILIRRNVPRIRN